MKFNHRIFLLYLVLWCIFLTPKINFGQDTSVELTEQEKVWISSHPVLNVGNEQYWPPIDFTADGEPMGYSIDLMNLIAKELGFEINYISGLTWVELMEALKNGDIDLLPAISKTAERETYIKFSKPYINLPYIKVINSINSTNENFNFEDKVLAVNKGSNIALAAISAYPKLDTIHINTILEGIQKVSTGEADVFIENLGLISYYLNESYIPNIKLVSDDLGFLESSSVQMGVLKKNKILGNLIDKGLEAISKEELNTLRNKWMPVSVESDKETQNVNSSDLWKIIILSIIAFLVLTIGLRYIFRIFMKEQISLEFGSKRFRTLTMLSMFFIVLIISLLGWWAMEHNKAKILGDLELNLETTLINTHERLKIWINQRESFIQQLGRDPVLVQVTQELLKESTDNGALLSSDALNKVRLFYEKYQDQLQSVGFFIINKEYLNFASSIDENIGLTNLIYDQNPGLISQVFKGSPVFIPPMESDVVLDESQNNGKLSNYPMMFFVTPVQSVSGEIIAGLIIQVDPSAGFSRVMQLARVGETGESYAFNHEGRLLSESRFDDDLRQIGLISKNEQGILRIEIRDPGGNMVNGFRSNIPRHQQSLTRMAASAIDGESGVDMSGYRDYRGVPVYGSWLWDPDLGLGLATEIDVEEGRSTYNTMAFTVVGVIGVAILLMVFAIMFTLALGERANKALVKAKNELEDRVKVRTNELNNERVFLNTLINSIPDLIFYKDIDNKYLGANEPFLKQLGKKTNEIIGRSDFDFLSLEDAEAFKKVDEKILKLLKPVTIETESIDVDGNYVIHETRKTPFFNNKNDLIGLIGITRDITERKEAEEEIRASENKFRAITSTATDVIISADKHGIIESWNAAAEKTFGYTEQEAKGQKLEIIIPDKYHDSHQIGLERVLTGGERKAIGRIVELEGQHKNGVIFPIELSLSVFEGKDGLNFSSIIRDITERKKIEAILVKAHKRMEDELNVAKDIQMSMLPLTFPAFPRRNEIDVYAKLIPAREVGGDFYDFFFIDEHHFCITIGDVSGKGVPAALMMAVTRTLLKSRASNDLSTASILTHVNNEISKENDNFMFITVFIAILNTKTGKLLYSNAGHNPTFIKNVNGQIIKLTDLHGPVIGAMEEITYKESILQLEHEDIIFAYTDGVTEAQNFKKDLFSDDRLYNLFKENNFDSSESLVNFVVDEIEKFEDGVDHADDITALSIFLNLDPTKMNSKNLKITIVNKLEEINRAIELFEAFAEKCNIPLMVTQKVNIVLDELLNNTISYAFKDENEHEIDIVVELYDEKMVLTLIDDGIPFNPFQKKSPDTKLSIEDRKIGGLGIHLVKNLMDEYEYEYKRNINKNIITLIKYQTHS